MRDYRLYCLDGERHIAHGEWIEAASDDEAIALVRAKRLGLDCELWEGARLVAKIAGCRADIDRAPTARALPD